MTELSDRRGVLYPSALPRFHRSDVPESLRHLARWYWFSWWNLPPGEVSSQSILPFPASNLVVQRGGVTLAGPTSRVSDRELSGTGWALGVLLRPGGLHLFGIPPVDLVDGEVTLAYDDLAAEVRTRMDAGDGDAASEVISRWLEGLDAGRGAEVPEGAVLADSLVEIAAGDPGVVDVDRLAELVGVSTRALQRLATQYIGQSPVKIIRRYRLQEAALRLRENPDLTVSAVAAELGYADQSHLATEFRLTLGLAARDYRRKPRP